MASAIANIFLAISRLLQIVRMFAEHKQNRSAERARLHADQYDMLLDALETRASVDANHDGVDSMSDDGFRRD